MTRVILVRHGRTTANQSGVLAGRADVELDDVGREQAARVGQRLAAVNVAAVVTSPMLRTQQTAQLLVAPQSEPKTPIVDERLAEVEYGEWTGRALKDLAGDPLWGVVQQHPAAVTFPGGESMAAMSARACASVREWAGSPAADGVVVVVSHGDVIKAILADALGMHLDAFQRIVVNPGSISAISYAGGRPFVERVNDCGEALADLQVEPPAEATPGGTTGSG
ncbi:MAG: MSMEG_4193 family putative phosphomutase [Candidatus Nanopelagicales bacterium]